MSCVRVRGRVCGRARVYNFITAPRAFPISYQPHFSLCPPSCPQITFFSPRGQSAGPQFLLLNEIVYQNIKNQFKLKRRGKPRTCQTITTSPTHSVACVLTHSQKLHTSHVVKSQLQTAHSFYKSTPPLAETERPNKGQSRHFSVGSKGWNL